MTRDMVDYRYWYLRIEYSAKQTMFHFVFFDSCLFRLVLRRLPLMRMEKRSIHIFLSTCQQHHGTLLAVTMLLAWNIKEIGVIVWTETRILNQHPVLFRGSGMTGALLCLKRKRLGRGHVQSESITNCAIVADEYFYYSTQMNSKKFCCLLHSFTHVASFDIFLLLFLSSFHK